MTGSTLGTLYGVGVGPGDPELITVKGLRLLQAASVVCCPAGKDGSLGYAYGIVADYVDESRQKVVALAFPMSRDPAVLKTAWDSAGTTVAGHLRAGSDVAFITEGDPLFYSTFIYLAESVRRQLPEVRVATVPGITSLSGCAAVAGLPLALGHERVTILPAPYGLDCLDRILEESEVVVLMKVAGTLDQVVPALERHGLLEKAVLVERCGTGDERVVPGTQLPGMQRPHYLSTLIICGRAPSSIPEAE